MIECFHIYYFLINMENCSNICHLTDDCLINIFKYCNVETLGRVACTCKRLRNVINNYDSIWFPKSRTVLGSNMISPIMYQKSLPFLTPLQRCKVSRNWISGDYKEASVMRYEPCMPWMCMERDFLYVSKRRKLIKLFRDEDGHIITKRLSRPSRHTDDLSKFVISGDEIISVGWDGKLCRYSKYSLNCFRSQHVHNHVVKGLDSKKDIIVTGSRDETIKIWRIQHSHKPIIQVHQFNAQVRVLSLSLLPSMRFLVAGLPGTRDIHPLPIFDIEKGEMFANLGNNFIKGAGIIDIYAESENLILTCGYDTSVKLWDLRAPQKCVSRWEEPYDNFLYTVKSDHNVTIVAGANRSGYFHIWDKRAETVIQTHHNREFESPVYCLAYDAAHIFTALSRAVVQHCFMYVN